MVAEYSGSTPRRISAAMAKAHDDVVRLQDDVAALQSPGGWGWRLLDDARSKLYVDRGVFMNDNL